MSGFVGEPMLPPSACRSTLSAITFGAKIVFAVLIPAAVLPRASAIEPLSVVSEASPFVVTVFSSRTPAVSVMNTPKVPDTGAEHVADVWLAVAPGRARVGARGRDVGDGQDAVAAVRVDVDLEEVARRADAAGAGLMVRVGGDEVVAGGERDVVRGNVRRAGRDAELTPSRIARDEASVTSFCVESMKPSRMSPVYSANGIAAVMPAAGLPIEPLVSTVRWPVPLRSCPCRATR